MRRPDSGVFLATLLLISILAPSTIAAASLSLSADSLAKEATTDDPAEYTIIVSNDGDEDLTVTLGTSQDSDCNGFTSSIDTTPFSLSEGESEEKTLTVSVNDQASGECETTVNANGIAGVETANDDIKVTTSAEGGGQYAVTLSYQNPNDGSIVYDGEEDKAEWTVKVENSGEQDNEQIQLSMTSTSDCDPEGLDAAVEPQTMTLNSGDSETATVTVNLPEGSSTESGDHCFMLEATVSNDPNTFDQANDSLPLALRIPQVKTCESSIDVSSHSLDPGQSATNSFSIRNTGNTAWTAQFIAYNDQGYDISDWIDITNGPSSKLLQEPGEPDDDYTFEFMTSPDDSVEPGTVNIYIQGRSGSQIGCETLLRLNLGQVRNAELSLTVATLNNIQPGSSGATSVQISNTGNGQDTFAFGIRDLAPGWQVELSQTTVTIDGKHCSSSSNCDREYVHAQISVPIDAKSGIEFEVIFTVGSSGVTHDEISVAITVAPVHNGNVFASSNIQTGRFNDTVRFPLDITNTGNIQDTFALSSCDPDINDTCIDTKWPTRFADSSGNEISTLILDSEQTERIYLEVEVGGIINNETESFEARIGIIGTEKLIKKIITVIVSDYVYSMSLAFESPEEDPGVMSISMPPGGEKSVSFLITNTGNGGRDEAIFSISGMDSSVVKKIFFNGLEVGNEVTVPSNKTVLVEIVFEVLEVESGTNGVVRVSVTSKKNTAQPQSFVDISLDIRTIHNLQFTLESSEEKTAQYPEYLEYILFVTNQGNTEEEIEVLPSDPLRGWSVDVIGDEFKLEPGQSRQVKVRATPPSNMISDEEYTFIVTVQPKGMPVAGQPMELTAKSNLGSGSVSDATKEMAAIAVIVVGSILVTYLFIRSRAENQFFTESLSDGLDD